MADEDIRLAADVHAEEEAAAAADAAAAQAAAHVAPPAAHVAPPDAHVAPPAAPHVDRPPSPDPDNLAGINQHSREHSVDGMQRDMHDDGRDPAVQLRRMFEAAGGDAIRQYMITTLASMADRHATGVFRAERVRIYNSYKDDLFLDTSDENYPFVRWIADSAKPENGFARRAAEREFLEVLPYAPDVPVRLQASPEDLAINRKINDELAISRNLSHLALRDYQGRGNIIALDQGLSDMQAMASGKAGVVSMQADQDALDMIMPPLFGTVENVQSGTRKNFLATINNATYTGSKENIHESNMLVMILTALRAQIEMSNLSEEGASQLMMSVLRGNALDMFMIYRKQPHGFRTFWSMIQALSKQQISPTQAIQRISKLKQTRIPSQMISGVIAEVVKLNHFTLPANQPKAERDAQYKSSVMRDLRDLIICQYPSFINQVAIKEREAQHAIEAQKAAYRSKNRPDLADQTQLDPISCLIQAMVHILHVESEGNRIEFLSIDDALPDGRYGKSRRGQEQRTERRSPRLNSVRLENTHMQRPMNFQHAGPPQQQQVRPRQPFQQNFQQNNNQRNAGAGGNNYPTCKRCGKPHPDNCRRYNRSSKFPCAKCKGNNFVLFHFIEDCNQHQPYINFANKGNRGQAQQAPRPRQFNQGPRDNWQPNRGNPPQRPPNNMGRGNSRPNNGPRFQQSGPGQPGRARLAAVTSQKQQPRRGNPPQVSPKNRKFNGQNNRQ